MAVRTKPSFAFPQRQLVSQQDQAIIQNPTVPRSRFLNTWTRKTAFDAGYLVPFLVDEVLPGDHLSYDVTAYVRLSTPLFPLFDNQRVDTFFFFVPNRIVWENWTKFMGEQLTPSSSIDYTVPQIGTTGGASVGTLVDHMGLPYVSGQIDPTSIWTANALPFRAYNLIYNTWFRDENIIDSLDYDYDTDADVGLTNYVLRKRAKSHDYFTSALPWPQKFTAPTVPVAGQAPVTGIGWNPLGTASSGSLDVIETGSSTPVNYADWYKTSIADNVAIKANAAGNIPEVYADLSQATGVAINTFRQAFMVQTLLERDARGGTRYVELIRSHFGVTNPDFRLQRPEYIGGGQSPLNITPIAQTAPTTGVPLGALGAAGTAAGSHRASYAATEHGFIIGIINVRSELSYQQGVNRQWKRETRYDYYWPSLAQMGEQSVLRQEIYALGSFAGDSDTSIFGYQERYQEYRTRTSEVTGIMRSTATGTLDAWHLAQKFTAAPTLSQTFIEDTPPMSRVLAAGALAAGQQYLADIMISRNAVRPIPTFGTPVALGRF